MWAFFRRQALYFLVGFVVAFIVYLFVRFNADAVVLGIFISVGAGVATSIFLWWLERQFNKKPPTTVGGSR